MRFYATSGLTRGRKARPAGSGRGGRAASPRPGLRLALAFAAAFLALARPAAAEVPPVPPLPPAATPYYVAEPGGARGPVALAIVIAEIRDGAVEPGTLVWKPGLSGWISAGSLPEFEAAFAEAAPAASPPPLPPDLPGSEAAAPIWFVAVDGAPRGPWTGEALVAAIAAGEVGPGTLIWRPGSPGWLVAAAVPELAGLFTITPPALPPALPPEPPPPESPPPEEPGEEEDELPAMVGTWEFGPAAGADYGVRTRIAFADDMTFTGEVSVAIPGGGTETQAIAGAWRVSEVAEGRFTLVLSIDGAAPSEVGFRILDADHLVNEADGSTARRVGG